MFRSIRCVEEWDAKAGESIKVIISRDQFPVTGIQLEQQKLPLEVRAA